jgi:hypothetical protein
MAIEIGSFPVTGGVQFTITDGVSICSSSSFQWQIFSGGTWRSIIGETNSTYTRLGAVNGEQIRVFVNEYTGIFWTGGEFYGGNFRGNFGGGTFHYGQLNDCFYLKQEIKPRPFIEDINKPTGPQSVKPVDTSRLL